MILFLSFMKLKSWSKNNDHANPIANTFTYSANNDFVIWNDQRNELQFGLWKLSIQWDVINKKQLKMNWSLFLSSDEVFICRFSQAWQINYIGTMTADYNFIEKKLLFLNVSGDR